MFGWNVHTEMYHILRIGKGLYPHSLTNKRAKKMYITLCPRKDYNAIQFLDISSPVYLYPQFSDPKLTIDTLCKDCLELSNKDKVFFELIKIKLGIK